jgi:hypothetical protein
MTRTLAWACALLLACGVVAAAVRTLAPEDAPAARPSAPREEAKARTETVLPPGQAEVTGAATTVSADAEDVGSIPAPFVIQVPTPGSGSATITGALIDGKRTTIAWDGGRPLIVATGKGVEPGPVHVEVSGATQRYSMDGAARGFTTGTYRIDTPVAVGAEGLAVPRDSVTFQADEETVLVTRGGAVLAVTRPNLALTGPGKVSAKGSFTVRTSDGQRPASSLEFGPGSYEVQLRTNAVDATFQGPLAAN